jgi:predicted dehydrogenase
MIPVPTKEDPMSPIIHRRDFLKQIGAAGAGLGLAGGAALSATAKTAPHSGTAALRPQGANDRIRTAVIGLNGRGAALAECFAGLPGVEVAVVCDVDERAIAKGIEAVRKYTKTEPRGLRDFRKVLEDPAIDAVAVASGGRYHFQDDWETPDTQVITWDYDAGKAITWESRSCNDYPVERLSRGVMIYGTEGSALLDGDAYTLYDVKGKVVRDVKSASAAADRTNPISATGLDLDQVHVKNFIDAVRTGGETTCGVEDAHKSTGMLHLGNIAWRVGRALDIEPATGRVRNDPATMELWSRAYEPGWEPVV